MSKLRLAGMIVLILVITSFLWSEPAKFLGKDLEIVPLQNIKRGMIGCYGLSDFGEGKGVQKFNVEIIGIEYDPSLLGSDYIIWAKISGGPNRIIDRAGVIAGMSGSPIFDDQNKLIGALAGAYGWQLPPEANAAITPIEPMLALQNLITAYYGQANFQPSTNPNILKPGDAIAGVILSGDLPLAVIGTVTWSNEYGFLAFGHPFFQTGYANIPAFKAEICTVIPRISISHKEKQAIAGQQLGTIVIDSFAGILGVWHDQGTMVPLKINFLKYYLNGSQTYKQWNINIAPRNPLSKRAFLYSLVQSIALTSPDLRNLFFNIRASFTYEEKGNKKTAMHAKSFFSKTGEEILATKDSALSVFEGIYALLEKEVARELVSIDINIVVTQEKTETVILTLEKVEAKDEVEPKEKVSLGLTLEDKYRKYKEAIEFDAPDFQGGIEIKIRDRNNRLEELIKEGLKDAGKIENVLKFIETSDKNDIFYVEIQCTESVAENQAKYGKNWQMIAKRSEDFSNKKIIEVEFPKIPEKFTSKIAGAKTITIKIKEKQKEQDKNKNQ